MDDHLRIDKNVAFNILQLQKFEDKQTQIIIKSLLIYFSYSYQEDLFNYKTLDPYDFANKMKLSKDTLFRTHPNPKQILDSKRSAKELYAEEELNGKFSGSRIWDSYLENALYILSTTSLFEHYKGSTDEHDFIGLKNFILIKDISIYALKVNKGRVNKIFYKYQLDDTFERNLRRFFLQTNFQNYIKCKSKNFEDFYLTISNIYNTNKIKGINKYHWKLDDLLSYFTISDNLEIKYKKRELSKKLKSITEILKHEIPSLKFYWIAGDGQKWKYVPVMEWEKQDLSKLKEVDFKVLDSVFLKHLKRSLFEIYLKQYPDSKSKPVHGYYNWLRDPESSDIKVACYVNTYSLHKKVSPFPKPQTLANSFFNKIKTLNTPEEIDNCFEPMYN